LDGLPVANNKLKCHSATLGNKALDIDPTSASNLLGSFGKPSNNTFGSYLLSYENITNIDVQVTLHS
jgi:hypothetical protein